jgi:integrase
LRYSTLVKVADGHGWTKKTYNNAISALRRAFEFGFQDHPEHYNPAKALKSARINKKDRPKIDPFSIQDAETLIAAIHRDWGEAQGNYDEFRFFTGLRPSEQIALVVSDYDAVNGVLSITKARVSDVDRDRTKIAEDRRVVLNGRARAVLERQLRLREQLERAGRIHHQNLFFHADGGAIRRLYQVHRNWRLTLKRLAIRYRRPYTARHSSVSWDLMVGGNPMYVAQQHGHRIITMLTTYAAWTEGSLESDVLAIRRAMDSSAYAARNGSRPVARFGNRTANEPVRTRRRKRVEIQAKSPATGARPPTDLAIDLPILKWQTISFPRNIKDLNWRSGRDSNPRPPA